MRPGALGALETASDSAREHARRLRRLTAGISAAGLAAGLAITAAGTAQAAVPDKWGFAFVDKPAVAGHSRPGSSGRQLAGAAARPLDARRAGPGVRPVPASRRQGRGRARDGGQQRPGLVPGAEMGTIRRRRAGRRAAASRRAGRRCSPSSLWRSRRARRARSRPGRAYGYVHFQPGPGIVASFNSAGAANTVTPGRPGVWTVKMPGLGSTVPLGGIQVTAVDPAGPAKCEVNAWGWSGERAGLPGPLLQRRLDPAQDRLDAELSSASARSPAPSRSSSPTPSTTSRWSPGPYAPAPAWNQLQLPERRQHGQVGRNGLRLVQFPRVGALPDNVLVTAFHVGPGFCNLLTLWATAGADRDRPRCRLLHGGGRAQEPAVDDHLHLLALRAGGAYGNLEAHCKQ